MKEKELILSVIHEYDNANKISANIPGNVRPNLRRGNRHVISYYLEDIIGAFIADMLSPDLYYIFVEQTFYAKNSRSQFKPDISIIKRQNSELEIVGLFEIKDSANPFRWVEGAGENGAIKYVKERHERIMDLSNSELYFNNNGKELIRIHPNIPFDLILFSDQLYKGIKQLEQFCNNVDFANLHILLRGYHPNPGHKNIPAERLIAEIESKQFSYSESSLINRVKEIIRLE